LKSGMIWGNLMIFSCPRGPGGFLLARHSLMFVHQGLALLKLMPSQTLMFSWV
jgi:hypothetical protein